MSPVMVCQCYCVDNKVYREVWTPTILTIIPIHDDKKSTLSWQVWTDPKPTKVILNRNFREQRCVCNQYHFEVLRNPNRIHISKSDVLSNVSWEKKIHPMRRVIINVVKNGNKSIIGQNCLEIFFAIKSVKNWAFWY